MVEFTLIAYGIILQQTSLWEAMLCALKRSESLICLPLNGGQHPLFKRLVRGWITDSTRFLSSQLLSSLLSLQPYAKTEPCNPARRYVTKTSHIPETLQPTPRTCADSQHVAMTCNWAMPRNVTVLCHHQLHKCHSVWGLRHIPDPLSQHTNVVACE